MNSKVGELYIIGMIDNNDYYNLKITKVIEILSKKDIEISYKDLSNEKTKNYYHLKANKKFNLPS